jgi:hypothetical protein
MAGPRAGQTQEGGPLREKARDVTQAGKLPNRRPDRMWGGPSGGADCAICSVPVKRDELELEIEFVRTGDDPGLDIHHVHVRCFAAWEHNFVELPRGDDDCSSETAEGLAAAPSQPNGDTTVSPHFLTGTAKKGMIRDGGCGTTSKSGPA